jgi:hypothetical protein
MVPMPGTIILPGITVGPPGTAIIVGITDAAPGTTMAVCESTGEPAWAVVAEPDGATAGFALPLATGPVVPTAAGGAPLAAPTSGASASGGAKAVATAVETAAATVTAAGITDVGSGFLSQAALTMPAVERKTASVS